MNIPEELRYTETHEWAKKEDNKIKVGITDHAQQEITDVVHVELPKVGTKVTAKQSCAVIESVKSAFDIYAPVSGIITEINEVLNLQPELVNISPYDKGYLFVIEPSVDEEWDKLLTSSEYKKHITE